MLNDNIFDILNLIKYCLKLISPICFYIFNVATRNFQISCGSHLWLSYFCWTALLPTKAKRIFLKHKYELVTRLLKTFQWLIIAFRIKFILLHMVFKPRPSFALQPYLSQPPLSTCPLHKHTPFVVDTTHQVLASCCPFSAWKDIQWIDSALNPSRDPSAIGCSMWSFWSQKSPAQKGWLDSLLPYPCGSWRWDSRWGPPSWGRPCTWQSHCSQLLLSSSLFSFHSQVRSHKAIGITCSSQPGELKTHAQHAANSSHLEEAL